MSLINVLGGTTSITIMLHRVLCNLQTYYSETLDTLPSKAHFMPFTNSTGHSGYSTFDCIHISTAEEYGF